MQNNKKLFSDFKILYDRWAVQAKPFPVYSLFSKKFILYTYLANSSNFPYGIKLRVTSSKSGVVKSAMFAYLQKDADSNPNAYTINVWEFKGIKKTPEFVQMQCELKSDEAVLKVLEEMTLQPQDLALKFQNEVLGELNIMTQTESLPTLEGKIFEIHLGNVE